LACRLSGSVIFLERVAYAAAMTVAIFGKSKGHFLSITTFIPPLKVEGVWQVDYPCSYPYLVHPRAGHILHSSH